MLQILTMQLCIRLARENRSINDFLLGEDDLCNNDLCSLRTGKKEGSMMNDRTTTTAWTANRIVALVIGIVFTLIGILGLFVSTSMTPGSLLGFDVDIVHNLVHLVTGLAGLAAAFTGWSRRFNQIFGIIYIIVGIAGLIYPALYFDGRLLGLMHVNAADHVLHLVVGLVAAGVGFFVTDYNTRSTTTNA